MLCRLCVCIKILLYDILFRDHHVNSRVENVHFRRFPIAHTNHSAIAGCQVILASSR